MKMVEFFQTPMGRKFFEQHVPDLIKQFKRLNENLSKRDFERLKSEEIKLHHCLKPSEILLT